MRGPVRCDGGASSVRGRWRPRSSRGCFEPACAPIDAIRASDPLPAARASLEGETGVTVYDSNLPVVQQSDVVVLAVKPQSMREVLENVRPVVTPEHLVVSVAAGITIASIMQGLSPGVRVVRVMPNTPALIGEGASAYALGPGVRPEDEARRQGISRLGRAHGRRRRSACSTPSPGFPGAGPHSSTW